MIKKYTEIQEEIKQKVSNLIKESGVFFAFSQKQFDEGKQKNPVGPGEKYTSLGFGGYLPSKNVKKYIEGMEKIEEYQKEEMLKVDKKEAILYELHNHECFYTGDCSSAYEVLKEFYTLEDVKNVYFEHIKN